MSSFRTFYGTSVGKKILVALTGALMILFLIGHMLGNLLIFEGRGPSIEETKLNQYAQLLRLEMSVLWTLRLVLVTTVLLHAFTTVKLWLENRRARPVAYTGRGYQAATVSSRSMVYGGIALFGFVVYHILHFTAGVATAGIPEPGFVAHDVYGNVVRSFQNPVIFAVYAVAVTALLLHLLHGFQSAFRTLGVENPRHMQTWVRLGRVVAVVLMVGFLSGPFAALMRWINLELE